MSLIERYTVERRPIDGVERDVLIVWTTRSLGERMPEALSEIKDLSDRLGYEHVDINIPAAMEPPVAERS